MIARRELLASTVLSSVLGREREAVPEQQTSDRAIDDIAKALKDLHGALAAQQSFNDILPLRQRMIEFLRANAKFPDFIDVGVDVWFAAYDWHIKRLQEPKVGRDGSGRYTLAFLHTTTLLLRSDADRNFISIPYDNR
jgi:hypothetical protein